MKYLKYLFIGMYFGIVATKAEVLSWFRIQEMFRFQSFHMYGIIGSAVAAGLVSYLLIKKFKLKTIEGEEVAIVPKPFKKSFFYGGFIFGLGWALTGACPGPMYALVGNGFLVYIVAIIAAIAGTAVYGMLEKKLPG